jgi:SnoaL-like domain
MENRMTAEDPVALYYDAWRNRRGDFSDVPLAEDFRFIGPVASFDSAAGYREMAGQAGQAVTSFEVRRQFVDGNTVCSIIDWEMAMPGLGPMTSAELLEVENGVIVRGELIYDAEALRHAMAQAGA